MSMKKKPAVKPPVKKLAPPPLPPKKPPLAPKAIPLIWPPPAGWPFAKAPKVVTIQKGLADQGVVSVRRRASTLTPDRLQWINLDGRGRTVLFKDQKWPFVEPPQDILIPAHGNSTVFTVCIDAADGPYDYTILPVEPSGPGVPEVDVNP